MSLSPSRRTPPRPAPAADDATPTAVADAADTARREGVRRALRAALRAAHHPWAEAPLQPLPDAGLAHDHVRLVGTGVLARLPKQSQMGWSAADNLAYQRACFERAAPGGHVPALHGVLPPSAALPRGGLLVEAIEGRAARLPDDLPAIARALAALHALALPPPAQRPPLRDAPDPLRDLHDEIAAQWALGSQLAHPALAGETAQALDHGLRSLQALCDAPARPPRRLIAFDAHPGNFVLRPDGRAVLVDLEKARYAAPGLDLAHATLYTSTTWDPASRAVLSTADELAFHSAWAAAAGPALADAASPWHGPLRRAMWLWSLSWCTKWLALSAQATASGADGEDWSAARSDATLVDHVGERVRHYLHPHTVARVREGFDALERELGL
jgi:hypothetical protein